MYIIFIYTIALAVLQASTFPVSQKLKQSLFSESH